MGRKKAMLSMVLGISILVLIVIIVKVIPQFSRKYKDRTVTGSIREKNEEKGQEHRAGKTAGDGI